MRKSPNSLVTVNNNTYLCYSPDLNQKFSDAYEVSKEKCSSPYKAAKCFAEMVWSGANPFTELLVNVFTGVTTIQFVVNVNFKPIFSVKYFSPEEQIEI